MWSFHSWDWWVIPDVSAEVGMNTSLWFKLTQWWWHLIIYVSTLMLFHPFQLLSQMRLCLQRFYLKLLHEEFFFSRISAVTLTESKCEQRKQISCWTMKKIYKSKPRELRKIKACHSYKPGSYKGPEPSAVEGPLLNLRKCNSFTDIINIWFTLSTLYTIIS